MIRFIDEPGIISPEKRDLGYDVAVTTFSDHLFDELLKRDAREVAVLPGGATLTVYSIDAGDKRVLAYKSPVGAPAAVAAIEEVYAAGVKNVVAFGICGALTNIPTRRLVVPTRAYRDEGTSYHYLPPSEYVMLKNSGTVEEHLKACGLETAVGGVWTTDGFYRETRMRMAEMLAAGCIAVDMEAAALQAASDLRGKGFYTFFITADSLAGDEWEPNYLLDPSATSMEASAALAAVKLANKL